jgi:MoaA/NifB/PqqE/SkfB family radical SAM enzyme
MGRVLTKRVARVAVAGECGWWLWRLMDVAFDGLGTSNERCGASCIIEVQGNCGKLMGNTVSKPTAGSKAKIGPTASVKWRRRARFVRSRTREILKIGKALVSTKHPFLVHIIPMRRCNLDCGYCNEYDDVSKPVPLEEMKRRLDLLADMGTSMITISGGEPLMHPEIEEVIRHMRKRGIYTGMITNGFLLSKERIAKLNDAGLEFLQISIDNVTPDEVSKKSWKTLDIRLEWLSQLAVFQVNINSVLGSGVKNPEDALTIANRAVELGFTSTVGIIHDGEGQLKGLNARQIEIFEEIMSMGKSSFSRFNDFQHNVARGKEHNWRCRSGSRYLYVCEDGLVHWCSQQRGYPGIPLDQYTTEMRHREYYVEKFCAPKCTVSCVQQVGILDNWRGKQNLKPKPMSPPQLVQIGPQR